MTSSRHSAAIANGEASDQSRGRANLERVVQPLNPRISLDLDPAPLGAEKTPNRIPLANRTEARRKARNPAGIPHPLQPDSRSHQHLAKTSTGSGPLEIDFAASTARAAQIQMTRCEVRRTETRRHSSRTGQTHSIGGFIGFAEYEGDLAEFLPYLEAARWTGVGRQAVWGKGEIQALLK